jgi:DNA (cytosine-5)-methyltransferase 1
LEGEILPWVSMADALGWSEGSILRTGANSMSISRDSMDMVPQERMVDAPAPTVDTKVGGSWKVGPPGSHKDAPQSWKLRMGNQEKATERVVDEPAPTVLFGHRLNDVEWVHDRPSTTVTGDPRIAEPGHKKDKDFPDSPGRMENAVRVTLEEAAALQSFPPDYPFQGTKTKRFEQVGNAVPPLLARAVLAALSMTPTREQDSPPVGSNGAAQPVDGALP